MHARPAPTIPTVAFAAGAILLLSLVLGGPPAEATSPYLPAYTVAYADSAWTITLNLREGILPLGHLWYWSSWNGTFESIEPHVGRLPTPQERVTFTDRDGDRNLSFDDALHVWDGNGSLANLTVAVGASTPAFDARVDLRLEPGYAEPCGPPPRGGP